MCVHVWIIFTCQFDLTVESVQYQVPFVNVISWLMYALSVQTLFWLQRVYVCRSINQPQSTKFSIVGGFVYLIE